MGLGKLTFVGLGLGDRGASIAGVDAIRSADVAYLEYYTSPHAPTLLSELEGASGRTLTIVDRTFVEDGRRILRDAEDKDVVLAVQGDPMVATTHNDLRTRATLRGIATTVIHGSTIAVAAASASGLHYYKFGATVTFTRQSVDYHQQVYRRVHRNLAEGSHTLLLLEFDTEAGSGVDPPALMQGLLDAERNFKREVVSEKTLLVVLSRVGTPEESVRAGEFSQLRGIDFGAPPHAVIVPGSMHFSEKEALAAICGMEPEKIGDNAAAVRRTAQVLIPRYAEKAKKALKTARESLKGDEYNELFENAELYIRDAEKFLADGEDELAMLSVGYAEGLIDSLTFTGKLKLEW
jgi:diphthine synthase